ncbi:hypothetical protein TcasGA2_TC001619 [Tribolium castaneum]|uniref:Uncharacterized protein n=1 Tax=Tribolium castaneum TaxID=7070 RepID=D6W6I8_TRICA|nr:hypothetical protein TcasGA2_TC001619 [Tribolium castaneum]
MLPQLQMNDAARRTSHCRRRGMRIKTPEIRDGRGDGNSEGANILFPTLSVRSTHVRRTSLLAGGTPKRGTDIRVWIKDVYPRPDNDIPARSPQHTTETSERSSIFTLPIFITKKSLG